MISPGCPSLRTQWQRELSSSPSSHSCHRWSSLWHIAPVQERTGSLLYWDCTQISMKYITLHLTICFYSKQLTKQWISRSYNKQPNTSDKVQFIYDWNINRDGMFVPANKAWYRFTVSVELTEAFHILQENCAGLWCPTAMPGLMVQQDIVSLRRLK